MRWAFVLLALALAGCQAEPAPHPPVPALQFGALAVETVPLEPLEARGQLAVTWQDGLFAVWTKNEGGMPAMAVRSGDALYTTQEGMGWTRWDRATYVETTPRGFRYLAWDIPDLLAHADVESLEEGSFVARSSFLARGAAQPVTIQVEHSGASVAEVEVRTAFDPESPYTLRPLAGAFPFPVAVPAVNRASDEVARLDRAANERHAQILALVAAYGKNHAGALPDRLDPESLRLEMLTTGASWPSGAYDEAPMHEGRLSGHFHWVHCASADGLYEGYGWDGVTVRYAFGKGCA